MNSQKIIDRLESAFQGLMDAWEKETAPIRKELEALAEEESAVLTALRNDLRREEAKISLLAHGALQAEAEGKFEEADKKREEAKALQNEADGLRVRISNDAEEYQARRNDLEQRMRRVGDAVLAREYSALRSVCHGKWLMAAAFSSLTWSMIQRFGLETGVRISESRFKKGLVPVRTGGLDISKKDDEAIREWIR